ncbi:MAG: acyl-CoA thioesterase [Bacteroidales bacterium]|nr:acyl-CoA thioesterase [Bacteroidales bacterium]
MVTFEIKIRVRYNETDRMGYLHHGVYPVYLEIARTEMLRSLGTSYRQLEDSGILLPVYSLNIDFKLPAFYDDELTVTCEMKMLPVVKLIIGYNVYNQNGQSICTANSVNAFVNSQTRKPIRAPESFLKKFEQYFDQD